MIVDIAIAAENVLVCVWSFLCFSTRTTFTSAQRYPIAAGALLLLFILYIFFNLFVLFVPFIICVALLLRMFWNCEGLVIVDAKQKTDQMSCNGDAIVSCSENNKSRRTNVKKMEWDAKGKYELPSPNDLVTKTVLLAKQVKALNMRHKRRSSNARKSIELDDGHSSLESDRDISSSSSSDEELKISECASKEGEVAQQNGTNKVMQWTDDDQRNLMELGSSEIERNKRLESLIARRRTRKLFKMQIEKGLIDLDTILPNQIAPLYITRNIPYVAETDGMQTPGSAPSVMFPARNPFDLPYDPLEEKPDLKTDSFQQEFTAAAQRDLVYSRHESFRYGSSYQVDLRLRALEGLGFSRLKRQKSLGNHDRRIEMLSKNEERDECVETAKVAVEAKGMSHTHIDKISEVVDSEATTTNVAMSARLKDKKIGENDIEGMGKMITDQNVAAISTRREGHLDKNVTDNDYSSDDESTSSSPSSSDEDEQLYQARKSIFNQNVASKIGRVPPRPLNPFPIPSYEKVRMEDRLFYAERSRCHTRSFSIASDMQVEVSDIGSPPLTVDGVDSPTDRESLGSECDVERYYTWEPSSSQISTTEENVSKFNDMHGLNEKDLANLASSANNKNAEDVVESAMHLQQPDELDDTFSISSTVTGLQADSRALSMNLEDVKLAMEEVGQLSTSDLSNALSHINQVEKLMSPEKLVTQVMESSSNSPDESTQENDEVANMFDDLKDEKQMSSGVAEAKSGLSQLSVSDVGELSSNEGDSVNLVTQGIEKNENSNRNEESKDMSDPFDAIKSSDLNQDTEAKQSTSQNDASDTRQTKDPIALADQQNLATQEEISKLPGKSTDEANVVQKIQAQDVSQEGTKSAAQLKVPAEEVVSVSEKETVANAETDKRENAKQNETVAALESNQTIEEIASVTKGAEKFGSILEKALEAPSEVKEPTKITEIDSSKAMQAHAELNKEGEHVESVSQKENMLALELRKTSEIPTETIKSTEEGSALHKSLEPSVELKKLNEETVSVSQIAAVTHLDLEKSTDVSNETPIEDFKRSVDGVTSVPQKIIEAPSDLEKSTDESGNVMEEETETNADVTQN